MAAILYLGNQATTHTWQSCALLLSVDKDHRTLAKMVTRLTPFDPRGAFRASADGQALRRLAVRGAVVTVLSSGSGLAIQIGSAVALARLLAPRDFGLIAMVSTFSLVLSNFGLNGFTEAILQRTELDRALANNIFWISVGSGLLLTVGFSQSGLLLARFYHSSLVTPVATWMSLTILVSSISVVHLALLKRAMLFSSLAANDFCSRVSSIIVSIVLAWAGCRHWALVAGAVAQPLTQCIGAWMLCRWKPGAPRRSNGTASTIRFAAHVYGRFVVNYFTRNVDNLIVGSQFGSEALGFYKRAYDLFALSTSQLTSPLTNVAVAALSRFSPSSLEYRHFLRRALATLAFVGMGIAMNLALIGNDLIRVLLGLGWETSGRIFSFFAPGIGVMVVYYVHGWIHLSIGRPERWLIWEVVEVTVTCLLFVLALPWGPVGIAAAWTAAFWVLTIPAFWYAGRPIGLGVKVALGTVWRYLVASIVAFWACEALGQAFPFLRGLLGVPWALLRIAMTSVLFGVVYLGAVVVLHRGNGPIRDAAQLLKEMKFLRKNSQPGAGVAAA